MKQKVTVADIAERVGLSKSAVAKVLLNNRSTIRVSRENAEKIRKLAEEMEYRPNTAARALRSGRSGMLGLVLGGLQSPFFSEFAERMLELADAQGRRLIVCPVLWGTERERAALDSLIRSNVDGILLKTGLFQNAPELAKEYAKYGIPIVTEGESHPDFSSVSADFRTGMRELFLAIRHQKIAPPALAANDHSSSVLEAYFSCCREFSVEPRLFRFLAYNDPDLDRCAAEISSAGIRRLLVCSDHYALKLMSRFGRAEFRIPEDIAIASIGGTIASSYANPPLTVIDQHISRLAELQMQELLAKLGGDSEIRHLRIPTELVIRESFPIDKDFKTPPGNR